MRRALAWLSLVLWSGSSVLSADFYPLGIYSVSDPKDLPEIKASGFNLVTGPETRVFLDAARQHQVKVLATPGTQAGTNFNRRAALKAVSAVDRHPALWAWMLSDEPELNQVSPREVRQAWRTVKLRGRKPATLVLYNASQAIHYAYDADFLMVDSYPIPWQPLALFGTQVRQARLALGPRKPLVAIIQAFDWACYPSVFEPEPNLRPPSLAELRCMTYLALAERATGLFYFAFDSGEWKIKQHATTWRDLQAVVREVNDRLPLFQGVHQWLPVSQRFADRRDSFNEIHQNSLAIACLAVAKGSPTIPPGKYLLVINTTPRPVSPSLGIARLSAEFLTVVGENRILFPEDGWLKDTFEPYAVRVYGPIPGRPGARPRR